MKEISISLIIIIIIFAFDISTQNYTSKAVYEMTENLENVKHEITTSEVNEESLKNLMQKAEQIKKDWKEKYSVLAYYIEHDELEKVETNISSVISFIENKEYSLAINQIDIAIFVLEHIEDKYQISMENIF